MNIKSELANVLATQLDVELSPETIEQLLENRI